MINASSKYWILVADSGHARILELRKKPREFHQVQELVSESQHLNSRDMVSDASGRAFHAKGPMSHSKRQRSDAHDLAEQAFSRMLVGKLEKAANLKAFEHLVLIADPKTLGRVRQYMSKALSGMVTNELNLDVVGMPLDLLQKKVRSLLNWPQ
jgi:protein required for attachment to host cells